MTVTLGGSGGQPGEAFGTPGGTGLVAGLSAAAGAAAWGWLLARVGGGRRGTSSGEGGMPGPSPRLARRVSRAGGGRAAGGAPVARGPSPAPEARGVGGGEAAGNKVQAPRPQPWCAQQLGQRRARSQVRGAWARRLRPGGSGDSGLRAAAARPPRGVPAPRDLSTGPDPSSRVCEEAGRPPRSGWVFLDLRLWFLPRLRWI